MSRRDFMAGKIVELGRIDSPEFISVSSRSFGVFFRELNCLTIVWSGRGMPVDVTISTLPLSLEVLGSVVLEDSQIQSASLFAQSKEDLAECSWLASMLLNCRELPYDEIHETVPGRLGAWSDSSGADVGVILSNGVRIVVYSGKPRRSCALPPSRGVYLFDEIEVPARLADAGLRFVQYYAETQELHRRLDAELQILLSRKR